MFASASLFGFSQTPCASTFNVSNNGGGACDKNFPGNGIANANSSYERSGLIEIRFEGAVGGSITPVITAIRPITSAVGQPVVTGGTINIKFALKGFLGTTRNTAEYCFYSNNGTNLNNAFGSRYQVDVSFTGSTATSICNITQNPDPIILPVTFGTFIAERKSPSSVFVKWNTLSEQNSKGFYIQRNSGNGWKDAGFVFSQTNNGYSSSNLAYEFKDVNIEKVATQYRILQVDNDGKGKYSDIRSVRGEGSTGKVVIYPNPSSSGKVNVVFESNSSRDITINDLSGRVIKQMNNYTDNTMVIENLPSGFYSMRILDKSTNESVVEKIIINKR